MIVNNNGSVDTEVVGILLWYDDSELLRIVVEHPAYSGSLLSRDFMMTFSIAFRGKSRIPRSVAPARPCANNATYKTQNSNEQKKPPPSPRSVLRLCGFPLGPTSAGRLCIK
jgi:hypothetical protein